MDERKGATHNERAAGWKGNKDIVELLYVHRQRPNALAWTGTKTYVIEDMDSSLLVMITNRVPHQAEYFLVEKDCTFIPVVLLMDIFGS